MESNNLISIVIPCYNDAQYIEQSVQSALDQTYSNTEVIVVDDGSNKETKAVLRKLEPKITKLITQENQGQSTARNVGIRAAKGRYILVLDSDDFFDSTFVEKAITVFREGIDVKIMTCHAYLILENGKKIYYETKGGEIDSFLRTNSALGTSMFLKEDWLSSGGYDENMKNGFEDWEFFIRLLKDGGRAGVIREPLYYYRKRSNTTTYRANNSKYDLLQYIYFKHKELYQEHFEILVSHLLHLLEKEAFEKIKNKERIEFKVGKVILSPLRWIKSLIN